MKKPKQILAALFCVAVFTVLAFSLNVSAEEYSGTCGSNLTWTLNTDTGILRISGTGDMVYGGRSNTAPWNDYNTNIISVIIGDGVTSIADSAFEECSSMTSITISDSVTSLGSYAFYNCNSLTSITIPDGVTSIEYYTFSGCTNLTSITIPDSVTSIGKYAFDECDSLTSVYITDVAAWCNIEYPNYDSNPLYYAKNLYINGELAKNITIPNGATIIGSYAFYNCNSLTSITIPDGVTNIGSYAFSGCGNLTSIEIPASITSIGDWVFENCTALESVYITDVAAWCNITFPRYRYNSNPLYFAKNLYINGVLAEEIIIPDGVTSINRYSFINCSNLTSITIPTSVTSIGEEAFSGCKALNEVNYAGSEDDWFAIELGSGNNYLSNACGLHSGTCGDDLTWRLNTKTAILTISGTGDMAKYYSDTQIPWSDYCADITSVIINDGVTSIGNNAFSDCTNLTSVSIPNGMTSIGMYAFRYCSSLTSITIPATVTSINIKAFRDCDSLTSVYITDIAAWCNIEFADYISNPLYYAKNLYLNGELAEEIIIPDGVTSISDYAFYNCTSLNSITIPDSTTSISAYAFYNCSNMTNITIPNTLTSIGKYAFYGCSSLSEVNYNGSDDDWLAIELGNNNTCLSDAYGLHAGTCGDNLTWILNTKTGILTISGTGDMTNYSVSHNVPWYNYRTSITSIIISDGVTNICHYAFYGCSNLTNIMIPDSVTSIGSDAFYKCSSLTSITIPDGVTVISYDMFYNCSKLTSITIPDSVTSIGAYAFYKCTGLTSITIPAGVTTIYNSAFSGCSSLSDVTYGGSEVDWLQISISDGNSDLTSAYCIKSGECGDDLMWILRNGVLTIGGTGEMENYSSYSRVPWYSYATTITSVTIADGVTSISKYAFYGCSNLTSITIPSSITSIGTTAFYQCKSLESVYITDLAAWCGISFSNNVSNPLFYAHNLHINGELAEEITIPDGVTSIGKYAFYNCSSITSVTIPESVTSIDVSAFTLCAGLTNVTIPESVTNIGSGAFAGCGSLNITASSDNPNYSSVDGVLFNKDQTKIVAYAKDTICPEYTIPDSVTSIGIYAFYYCYDLTDVTIPDSVTSIGYGAFFYCESLTGVTIPNSVTSISDYTFYYCTGLTSITIPKSVTSIGESAFEECNSLTDVYYGGSASEWSAITIGSYNTKLRSASKHYTDDSSEITVFNGTCGDNLTWELDTETGILTISGTGAMTDFEFTDENDSPWSSYIDVIKSVVIEDGVTSIGDCTFVRCENLTSVTIPDTVTHIGDYAFEYCYNLSSITMGNNVTHIGIGAFEDCAFTSIIIPDSVTYIGDYAFIGCDALTSVTIGSGVRYIGDAAFSYAALISVVLPEGLTTLNNGTFRYCENLKSVTIPRSMTYIVQGAFYDCSSLTDIYYNGSESDWECVEIEDRNDPLLNATVHYGMADYTEETYYSIGKYEDAAEAEVIVDEDGEVTINLIITDESALSTSNVTAYAVSYSGDTIEAIDKLSKTITSDGATFTGSVSGAYKIFIWDENMQPITEKIE